VCSAQYYGLALAIFCAFIWNDRANFCMVGHLSEWFHERSQL